MTINLILFFSVAVIAIVSALGMLFSANAIYAALYLIVNFAAVAVIYLLLDAPFIAVAQIAVYAGAIMVLFLFVIMLLGAERALQDKFRQQRWWAQPLPLILGGVLLVEGIYLTAARFTSGASAYAQPDISFGEPFSIGKLLFSEYLLPFEATSILLLIAMIGAIVLTRVERK